ncbi:MAG: SpvB/TcaC N-terminal domain-containing protein [Roseibium sp.]
MDQSSNGKSFGFDIPKSGSPGGGGRTGEPASAYSAEENFGTGFLPIPLELPGARELSLTLSINYASGSGNGLFGMGFSANIPSFAINLRLGVPKYDGTDPIVFGVDELVPSLFRNPEGEWVNDVATREKNGENWWVSRFQPRIESDFTLIEFWLNAETGESHWQTTGPDNTINCYGLTSQSRISDPEWPTHVAEWLIETSENAKGERILFHYRAENGDNVPDWPANAHHRIGSNRYPDRIEYGNYYAQDGVTERFAYQVMFDYGGFDLEQPGAPPTGWPVRNDPYSTYNSGFERRCYRLCQTILLYVSVPELFNGKATLTRAYSFGYDEQPEAALLTSIQNIGYRWQQNGTFSKACLPALRLKYSDFDPQQGSFHQLTTDQQVPAAPGYLTPDSFQLVDLDGDGLPGILQSGDSSVQYWRPGGGGKFSETQLRRFPLDRDLGRANLALLDIESNGTLDLVVSEQASAGFYSNDRGDWESFQTFAAAPTSLTAPHSQFVDLDGNGRADLLQFREDYFVVHPSLGKKGFGKARTYKRPFPLANADDKTLLTTFADVIGDGLQHWVTVSNGQIRCWPNLGHGHFGAPVQLDCPPVFDATFDASRIRLIDTDGSGCADLLYLHSDRIDLYKNLNGNGFSQAVPIPLPMEFSELDGVTAADVLGSGCTGIVLTFAAPQTRQLFYDFGVTGEIDKPKPYLLTETDNQMGALVRMGYRSSTQDYLADLKRGQAWLTKLPFPVQVVGRMEVLEQNTGTRLVSTYSYHDGFYDKAERRFNGFGYVERRDTETFLDYCAGNLLDQPATLALANELHQPPRLVKTWYDVGAYDPTGAFAKARQRQFFSGDTDAYDMPPTWLDPALLRLARPPLQQAEAATRGRVLREEIYGEDGSEHANVPYNVTQSRAMVRLLQPIGPNSFASFLAADCETITYEYERAPHDPRVSHSFALNIDAYGNVVRDCGIHYPRRADLPAPETSTLSRNNPANARQPEQDRLSASVTLNDVINATKKMRWLGLPCKHRLLELSGLSPSATGYFSFNDLSAQVDTALENILPYLTPFTPEGPQARDQKWARIYYWNEDQTAALPLGETASRALQHHQETAAFPDGLLSSDFLFHETSALVPDLNNGVLPQTLLDRFRAHSIALPPSPGSVVTVIESDQIWSVADLSTGQVYPVTAETGQLSVSRQIFGGLAGDLAEEGGYWLDDGYWWNRGETDSFFTEDACFFMRCETNNSFAVPGSELQSKTVFGYDKPHLFVTSTSEWLSDTQQNVTQVELDYQALQPRRTIDPNLIVSETLFDPLARPLATSLYKGNTGDAPLSDYLVRTETTFDDILARPQHYLQEASSFEFQDAFAWLSEGQPVSALKLTRETYVSEETPGQATAIQIEISYQDGFKRTIEEKRVSEPGKAFIRKRSGALAPDRSGKVRLETVPERWWVSGRTVYNNKGLAVKAYQPYFSNTPLYEDQTDVIIAGLLPAPATVRYDAVDRAIRLDTPKGFFTRSVFQAWTRWQFDENDTVTQSVYYKDHIDNPATPPSERTALRKAAIFDDTPDALILDPRGNPVRKIQTLVEGDDGTPTQPVYLTTRLTLDATGQPIAIADPRFMAMSPPLDNVQFVHDMTGGKLMEAAVDSGTRARLEDIFGAEIRQLDGRGIETAKSYDPLRRLTSIRVRSGALCSHSAAWWVAEVITYGEGQPDDVQNNLRGEVYQSRDQAGQVTYPVYNLQAQPLTQDRRLAEAASGDIDWSESASVPLDPAPLVTRWHYDALGRVTGETLPDGRAVVPGYGASSHLTTLSVREGEAERQIVTGIDYDPAYQRTRIVLGNAAVSHFTYEKTTLRLTRVKTEGHAPNGLTGCKQANGPQLQDRSYTYDPVGNVVETIDATRHTTFFAQQEVVPCCDYTTDSLYRLIHATGVQQPGLALGAAKEPKPLADARDGSALEKYQQAYRYDDGGNLRRIRHQAASGNWTRKIDIAPLSNRGTPVGGTTSYDANGNMLSLDALSGLAWSWRNGLLDIAQIEREDGDNDASAFQYDGRGQRLRKTTKRIISASEYELEETVYLGSWQRRRLVRVSGETKSVILERHDLRVLDDPRYGEAETANDADQNRDAHGGRELAPTPRTNGRYCFATEYRWTIDTRQRETKSPTSVLTRYPLQTLLGSITLELDDNAAVISCEEYYPYGENAVFAAASTGEKSLKMYRYVGKERDGATGLYYYGARYYVAALGRWLSADPAGFNDGPNLYLYVGGNPVTYTDTTGLAKITKPSLADLKKSLSSWKTKQKNAEKRVKSAEKLYKSNPSQHNANKLAKARKERGTAKGMVTRYTHRVSQAKSSSGSVPTTPAFYNPGGPAVMLQPSAHPGPSAGTLVASPPATAYIADLHKKKRDAQTESDVRNYTMMANQYIKTLSPQQMTCVSTDRKITGSVGYLAGQIAGKERNLANASSPGTYGTGIVVGHVPDVGATGVSYSPLGWFGQTKVSNNIVGGGLYLGRVITVYLVKETDGNVYQY